MVPALETPDHGQARRLVFADSALRILAVTLTIAAVAVHVYAVTQLGAFWRDEAITINLATVSLREAMVLHRFDGYPPLYAFLLRIWTLGGHFAGPEWLRCFGLAVGLASVASLWVGARWTGTRYPVIGLIIVGLNPAIVRLGDTLRPAGLGVAFAVLTFGSFWKLVRDGTRRDAIRAAITATLLVNTVYPSALLVLALGIAGIATSLINGRRATAAKVFVAGAVAALSMLPWAGYMRAQAVLLSTSSFDPPAGAILRAAVSAFAPICLLAPVIIAALAAWQRWFRPESTTQADGMELHAGLAAALTLVFVGAFAVSLDYLPSIWYFYPIVTVGALALDAFLGAPVYLWARAAVIVASLLWLPGLPNWKDFPRQMSNIRDIAAVVENQAGPDDFVMMAPPAVGVTFNYYYHGQTPWSTAPPISELRVYRLDLMLDVADIEPVTPDLRERARRTIEDGGTLWWMGYNYPALEALLPDPPPACAADIDPTHTPVEPAERLYLRSWSVANCGGMGGTTSSPAPRGTAPD